MKKNQKDLSDNGLEGDIFINDEIKKNICLEKKHIMII